MEFIYSSFFTNSIECDSEGASIEQSVKTFISNYIEFFRQQYPNLIDLDLVLSINLDINLIVMKISSGQYIISQYSQEENENSDEFEDCLVENFILNDEQLFSIEESETFEHESEDFFSFISEFRKTNCAN